MDNQDIAHALLQLSATTAAHAEHAAETDARAAGLNLPLTQLILSGSHPTRVLPHQFRELGITEGPSIIQKFSAKKWTFHVQGQPYNNSYGYTSKCTPSCCERIRVSVTCCS